MSLRSTRLRFAMMRLPRGLLLALAAGAVVRSVPAVGANFPLGDGGLFAQMALDLRANGFIPPETVTYYGAPWVYPPLSLYLLAAVPGDPVTTLRWLPIVWSVLLIAAVWLLANEIVGRKAANLAALAYALLPWSYWWLIQGGGMARALGALFAVLAIWAAAQRRWLPLGLFAGLTVITHPEAALFALISIAIVWAFRWRSWHVLFAAPLCLLIAGIWLAVILPRLGLDGLVQGALSRAGGLGGDSLRKVIVLAELWPAMLLGLLGVAVSLRFRRSRWLVLWSLVCMLLPGAIGRWVAVPWAILIGLAIEPVVSLRAIPSWASVPVAAAVSIAVALTVRLPVLPDADRTSMSTIAIGVPPGVTYSVFGSAEVVEWFPFVAAHHSTTTAVGYEWVGGIKPERADRTYGHPQAP